MNELEREEFKQRMEALTTEEKEVVVHTLSNEILVGELKKRLDDMTDNLTQIKSILY